MPASKLRGQASKVRRATSRCCGSRRPASANSHGPFDRTENLRLLQSRNRLPMEIPEKDDRKPGIVRD
ncbi:MAG: hypothetical protein J7641_23455 [Cyanobacteria bacterium SID2]|nr:hypothetical protein [Cyanobacteria bacterium SID2]MBP0002976.1 hypothetical protein [Cyanobacteria bacterium SBC]